MSKRRKRKPAKGWRKSGEHRAHSSGSLSGAPSPGSEFDAAAYLSDLSPVLSKTEVKDILDRRLFAVPERDTTFRGAEFGRLNPADPDQRGILIKGEHPEYRRALEDPAWEGEIDGVNPRLHVTLHEMVANQLWDGEPIEAWHAARRMLDLGMDRHDVLHELMSVGVEHLHDALTASRLVDLDAYRRALNDLGHEPANTRVRRSHTTYQVKVGIVGSEPLIWRRLSLPGDTPLDELHHILQVSFGWEGWHLHEFEAKGRRYTDVSGGSRRGVHDERRATLSLVAPRKGDRVRYTYDFGDDWIHDLVVEAIEPAEGEAHVVCLDADRAGPPEDCGGIYGYQDLLDATTDPRHPHRDQYEDVLGESFDPAAVDLAAINSVLAAIRIPGTN
ncbi:plasmid pRiA4b ORF-3 family protein [Saccharopolyspora spinosa]|uniref:plasmid pRiA4b ORF-3 family protein n=1 Tax=Saccharopolyspora spinosa TaxID=60894 RepID=UPI0014753D76|nr:plasmid pRiA4b ORF-3 family protein [Saccharopolyspora spinosa]